jgi:hypothetical protein
MQLYVEQKWAQIHYQPNEQKPFDSKPLEVQNPESFQQGLFSNTPIISAIQSQLQP